MNQQTVLPGRRRLPARYRPFREFLAVAFPRIAFCATFFGLFMLVVFFVRISIDVAKWFQTMPELVHEENTRLEQEATRARDLENMLAEALQEKDEEEKEELAMTDDEKQKQVIRNDFEKIRKRKREETEALAKELLRDEEFIRPNTSAPALLGHFFTNFASNRPQEAGIMPALLGSILLGMITMVFSVPLGLGAAIYLEEYRSSGWLARIIQVNINNLAGVPSVMYGVLGAYVFVELIFKPLESETIAARNLLGGGLTLALLTLPVIIISAQEAIRTVPSSLRHAAFALGATRWQVIRHVVLPAAAPGILTGVILAMSRALGEAAPLVLFGANLYINHNPTLFSRFTVLPLQIFDWASRPSAAFMYDAAMASAVLLIVLLGMNAAAIYLRLRAQKNIKW